MERKDIGILINEKNVKLLRFYFKQAVRLLGIQTMYYAPKKGMEKYDRYAEFSSHFELPIKVGVIFEEHPNIWTMKKLGWDTELQEGETLIHVPYDTPGLERGGVFEVPSGIDNSPARRFRILRMRTSMVYPSEVVCHIAPEMFDVSESSQTEDFTKSDFNLLNEEED